MRLILPLFLLSSLLPAQYRLYTCMVTSKGYVVGARLPASGIFVKPTSGAWEHVGYNHPDIAALDYDPRDPSTLYLAAGNGLIRATNFGRDWKIMTGNDVTELRDLAVDRNAPGTIYFAHTLGIQVTHDGGATWKDAGIGLFPPPHLTEPGCGVSLALREGATAPCGMGRRYTESIRVDRRHAGRLVAGTEDGLFSSADGGLSWRRAGAAGFQVMHIEQSPHDACFWLAVTQQGGAFVSTDCAQTFESLGHVGAGRNLYDIAFDPTTAGRIALAAWGPGVLVSGDKGKTWQRRNRGLPATAIWSVAFDPAHPGRLYASVHEEALYVSDDAGLH
ncbi:MAG: WD40/YVTN/BNR-like repeat-containing protein, partial [Pseudomonadota bacterium]